MPPLSPFGPLSTVHYTVSGVDFDTVRVPPGRFVDGKGVARRELLVSRPFEVGVTLATQTLWRAVMGENPSRSLSPSKPVDFVSWEDVQSFLGRLRDLGFPGFRLPTEAEWTWAARCGVPTLWAGAERWRPERSGGSLKPVACLPSAAAGVFDFSGSASEWLFDWDRNLTLSSIDPTGSFPGIFHVFRGGGSGTSSQAAMLARRGLGVPTLCDDRIGFRLFRSVDA